MFDGLAAPDLRTGSPTRLDLDTSDSINRGLSGWWPFLDGAGTIADISGAKRNGAPYGTPTRTASRVGRLGTLSSSNGYIAPDRPGNLARYSYVFWVRGSATPANFAGVLVRTSAPGGTNITNSIQVYSSNLRVYHDQSIDPPGDTGITTASILDGKLHCVAVTYDGATVYGFRDGRFVGSASMAVQGTPRTGSGDLLIGLERSRTSGYSWANQIGNVREWDRQLTSAEIERLFVEPFAGGIAPEDRLIWTYRVPTGGTTYNDTISDAITVTDSIAVARTASLATSDAVTAADSMPGLLTGAGATSDAVTATDSLTVDRTADVTISDDVVAGDSATGGYTYSDTISDDVTLGDSVEGEIATLTARGYTRGRSRSWEDVWEDVPSELQPVVSLAEHYVDLPRVEDVVTEQLARYARLGARASLNRRMTLLEEVKRTIVAVVAQAAEDDDEDALIQLL